LQQSYGFLMHLRVQGVEDKQFLTVLKMTEDLMLRRHVCRERTNETETLFAALCGCDSSNALAETRKTSSCVASFTSPMNIFLNSTTTFDCVTRCCSLDDKKYRKKASVSVPSRFVISRAHSPRASLSGPTPKRAALPRTKFCLLAISRG
jgi:hypothetical protein